MWPVQLRNPIFSLLTYLLLIKLKLNLKQKKTSFPTNITLLFGMTTFCFIENIMSEMRYAVNVKYMVDFKDLI